MVRLYSLAASPARLPAPAPPCAESTELSVLSALRAGQNAYSQRWAGQAGGWGGQGSGQGAQPWGQVALEEFEEPTLVVPGSVEDEVIHAGIHILPDGCHHLIGI